MENVLAQCRYHQNSYGILVVVNFYLIFTLYDELKVEKMSVLILLPIDKYG